MGKQRVMPSESKRPRHLFFLTIVSSLLYGWLLYLGPRYTLEVDQSERPLLLVIGIYLAASLAYLATIRTITRMPSTRWLIGFIVVSSIWFRALLLPTPPFQEIDLYRYLWDGAMTANGLDPYVIAPQEIVDHLDGVMPRVNADEIERCIEIVEGNRSLDSIVRTIHYAELPSPYPPVSQAIFAASHLTAGQDWSEGARVRWLKLWLTLFDVATLLLLLRLLWRTGLPLGWGIAYGWCPLVLKEFAGSGHLDSIAIFFTLAALTLVVEAFENKRLALWYGISAAALLALGVGAKLYPILLAPLIALSFYRRFGWRTAMASSLAFVLVTAASLAPMLLQEETQATANAWETDPRAVELPAPPHAGDSLASVEVKPPQAKTAGIAAFLKQWEMNDFLFMLVYENLRNQEGILPQEQPWFDLTPNAWSDGPWGESSNAFLITRCATLILFVLIAIGLATWASHRETTSRDWLRAAFLTLAWFWLLAPTQNPWYWCWAIPLLPFARSKAWRWFAVVLFGYYLRFWLQSHATELGVLGTPYAGEYFFYFVVSCLEHGPLLAWLSIEALISRSRIGRNSSSVSSLTDDRTSAV